MIEKIQLTTFQRFFRTETVGGSILLLFALAALVLVETLAPFRWVGGAVTLLAAVVLARATTISATLKD